VDEQERVKDHSTMGIAAMEIAKMDWFVKEVNDILGKEYAQKVIKEPFVENKTSEKKIRQKIVVDIVDVDEDFLEEETLINEDIRMDILHRSLEEHVQGEDPEKSFIEKPE
jgi:hypothetical protein